MSPYMDQSGHPEHSPTLNVKHMASDIMVHEISPPTVFSGIDAVPVIQVHDKWKSLDDLAHFPPALIRNNPIIMPDPSVDDLIAKILDKQEPMRREYFLEQAKNNRAPAHTFHAQIITIAA